MPDVGRHGKGAAGHALQQRQWLTLRERGDRDDVRPLIELHQCALGLPATALQQLESPGAGGLEDVVQALRLVAWVPDPADAQPRARAACG